MDYSKHKHNGSGFGCISALVQMDPPVKIVQFLGRKFAHYSSHPETHPTGHLRRSKMFRHFCHMNNADFVEHFVDGIALVRPAI